MSEIQSKPPLGRQIQARMMSLLNVPMRVLLQLPFSTPLSRQLMLITFKGRKTGKIYRQPVSYVQQDNTLLTPGGGKWKLNLRESQPVRTHLRGQDVFARPELVKNPDEIEHLLGVMTAANPSASRFVGTQKDPMAAWIVVALRPRYIMALGLSVGISKRMYNAGHIGTQAR